MTSKGFPKNGDGTRLLYWEEKRNQKTGNAPIFGNPKKDGRPNQVCEHQSKKKGKKKKHRAATETGNK